MRSIEELRDVENPAWPLVQEWFREATNPIEILPPSADRDQVLHSLQVTKKSVLGSIIHETGGLLVAGGLVRVLGSGHPRLPRSIHRWNLEMLPLRSGDPPPAILVADDVFGGFFAIDGGAFGKRRGEVHYLAPDTLAWEARDGVQYSDLISWCASGDVAGYYETWLWTGWEEEVARIPADRGLSIIPPLVFEGPPIPERSRRPVPLTELFELHVGTDWLGGGS